MAEQRQTPNQRKGASATGQTPGEDPGSGPGEQDSQSKPQSKPQPKRQPKRQSNPRPTAQPKTRSKSAAKSRANTRKGAQTSRRKVAAAKPDAEQVEDVESQFQAWLLASLDPLTKTQPAADSGLGSTPPVPTEHSAPPPEPEPATEIVVAEPEPAAESAVGEPEPAVGSAAPDLEDLAVLDDERDVTAGSAVEEEVESTAASAVQDQPDLENPEAALSPSPIPPDSSQEDGHPVAGDPASDQLDEQRIQKNGFQPQASSPQVPVASWVSETVDTAADRAAPYQPPAWVADVLADTPRQDTRSLRSRDRTDQPPVETTRESRRRRPSVAVVVLFVTAVALTAFIWRIIAIERGSDSSSAREPGSVVIQEPYGEHSTITITKTGQLVGETHLVLDRPIPALTVEVMTPSVGSSLSQFHPIISQLTAFSAGKQIKEVGEPLHSGQQVSIRLRPATRTVDLYYHAAGVMDYSEPSVPGRGTVLVTPMIMRQASDLYVSIDINSPYVSNAGCSYGGETPDTCGEKTPDGLRVKPTFGDGPVSVLAQVTLPTG
jgi:hypothetical protein